MATQGLNHSEGGHADNDRLVKILAEMVISALEWESDSRLESDPDSSLNQDSTGIDYPPTEPQPVPIA